MRGYKENHLKINVSRKWVGMNRVPPKDEEKNKEFPKIGHLQQMIRKLTNAVIEIIYIYIYLCICIYV